METAEKECGALGGLFQAIINDMKSSYPIWEDFNSKATKLHSQLRTTVLAAVAFLDAFQKVADMATNTRGATRDIGSALTRMCMRHRSIEAKLRQFTNALMESLINPLQDRIEDWKKTANQLDKDHAKEYKRARHEIKKKSSDTLKLQKKAQLLGKGDLQPQLDNALQDVNDMYLLLEETEKQAVRKALIEERGRFCTFITFLQPVVNGELTMLGEITHLQGIIDDLVVLTAEPHKLPPASEQVIKDLKGSDYSWSYQTPPSSPSSSSSRKSSMCSSVSSAKGGLPWPGGAQTCSPSSTYRYRSLAQPASAGTRLSSVSSHDSGFISQDAAYSKPPSPMPSDITSQKSSSSASSEASETCQSVSECSSPTSDWSKASPYDQPVVSTLQRRKDRVEHLREAEMGSASGAYPAMGSDDAPRPRMSPATIAAKHGEEVSPAASDLAMVLTRGLSLEHQKSSRDSLQYSSGYSTQTTTPSCSEDTIPSQGTQWGIPYTIPSQGTQWGIPYTIPSQGTQWGIPYTIPFQGTQWGIPYTIPSKVLSGASHTLSLPRYSVGHPIYHPFQGTQWGIPYTIPSKVLSGASHTPSLSKVLNKASHTPSLPKVLSGASHTPSLPKVLSGASHTPSLPRYSTGHPTEGGRRRRQLSMAPLTPVGTELMPSPCFICPQHCSHPVIPLPLQSISHFPSESVSIPLALHGTGCPGCVEGLGCVALLLGLQPGVGCCGLVATMENCWCRIRLWVWV
ncbi:protein MTSS 2 isoform X3 [Centrocercus urophasianus]|uniref:protein MTSS 2 isoform X3 n=1 Tax=Centrocercus urophasianus TaxID=9002 RepID=UPI001C649961|nr:protein MTSS 2 isoform X3 [Centrocercus urophasianus]